MRDAVGYRGYRTFYGKYPESSFQGSVVQSIVSLTSSLRGQLVKFFATL